MGSTRGISDNLQDVGESGSKLSKQGRSVPFHRHGRAENLIRSFGRITDSPAALLATPEQEEKVLQYPNPTPNSFISSFREFIASTLCIICLLDRPNESKNDR